MSGDMSKRVCNAAVALSYLNDWHNSIPEDRLAIVANLCDYYICLRVPELQNLDVPLSACMLVLALINGDFSLLTPESYNQNLEGIE